MYSLYEFNPNDLASGYVFKNSFEDIQDLYQQVNAESLVFYRIESQSDSGSSLIFETQVESAEGGQEQPPEIIVEPPPPQEMTLDEKLRAQGKLTINYGTKLFAEIKIRVWAVNAAALMQGHQMPPQEMLQLLSLSKQLEDSLCGGALDTGAYVCNGLKAALPAYTDVCDYALNEITEFNRSQGQ